LNCRVKLRVDKLTSTKTLMPLDYYILPFCAPEGGPEVMNQNLGQFLAGDRIQTSPYYLEMKKDMYCEQLCVANLGRAELPNVAPNKMVKAIRKDYHNNWIVDNMPSASKTEDYQSITTRYWSGFPVGFLDKNTKLAYVHNHVNIEIMYHPVKNESGRYRVVRFTVQPFSIAHDFEPYEDGEEGMKGDRALPLVGTIKNPIASCASKSRVHTDYDMVAANGRHPQLASGPVLFTYDAIWIENHELEWASRWDIYLNMDNQVPAQVHWYSIANSLVVGFILCAGIVAILVKNLRRDLSRLNDGYATDGESGAKNSNEPGWKALHADVFRPPSFSPMLLSVCCGSGSQLLSTSFFTIVFAALGFMSPARRGCLITRALHLYASLGVVNGYVSARLYKAFTGKSSHRVTRLASLLFPGIAFGVFSIMNFIAWGNMSTLSVPLMSYMAVLFLWFGIATPLVYAGAMFAFKHDRIEFPIKATSVPRPIPRQPWLLSAPCALLMGGILPFASLYVELYYIMASTWKGIYYYVFGVLLIVFIILLVTCAEVAVLLNFAQLRKGDHRWWWRSFTNAGATALYVFAYSILYFQELEANAVSTYIMYFGYMALASLFLFLLMGTVGVASSFWFNKQIFGTLKVGDSSKPLLQNDHLGIIFIDELEKPTCE
jgi:transmembrane 9 superfamily member 2/4